MSPINSEYGSNIFLDHWNAKMPTFFYKALLTLLLLEPTVNIGQR